MGKRMGIWALCLACLAGCAPAFPGQPTPSSVPQVQSASAGPEQALWEALEGSGVVFLDAAPLGPAGWAAAFGEADGHRYAFLQETEGTFRAFAWEGVAGWAFYPLGPRLLDPPPPRLGDVGGDGTPEIFLHIQADGSGITGPFYQSYLLRQGDGQLQALYDSTRPEDRIDLGFQFAFLDGGQGVVRNTHLGTRTVLDTSAYGVYNEKGELADPLGVFREGVFQGNLPQGQNFFLEFSPQDQDGDGVAEVQVAESFFVSYQMPRRMGTCHATLRWEEGGFSLVDAWFTALEDGEGTGDSR
ncbi:MAG TPA: hypothetical protein H9736_09520 [Candidatus Anaerotruncus excrementipullorum]|uniref:Lipoprotein n=1 Tax=Candidatus Anaerotruncus excrementipullorum TaxID=2838465 RepID=A0A9D1WSJ9_9FIRM|nr:hypothetical protein [Candidatus Anaerotruncus excrementipullorum]